LAETRNEMKELKLEIREEMRIAGRDAIFIAILGITFAVGAYIATDDFLERFSTLRFLTVTSAGYCLAKLFMLFPSRFAKAGGAALTLVLFAGSVIFIGDRYDLFHGVTDGFHKFNAVLDHQDQEKLRVKWMVLLTITLLSALVLLYPFTLT